MKEEILVELLERRFVTADGVIVWNEQVKGLIDGAINRASKNFIKPDVIKSLLAEIKAMTEHLSQDERNEYFDLKIKQASNVL